ncbi:MAG: extracellular solute-binding protein [Caldilineaceae bacterium]
MVSGCAAPAAPGDAGNSSSGEETIELTFAIGGGPGEIAGYNRLIDEFEALNPGVTIELLERPGQGFRDQIVAELAAGEAPDLIKVGFIGDFAFYASAGGTVDPQPVPRGGVRR